MRRSDPAGGNRTPQAETPSLDAFDSIGEALIPGMDPPMFMGNTSLRPHRATRTAAPEGCAYGWAGIMPDKRGEPGSIHLAGPPEGIRFISFLQRWAKAHNT